MNQILMVEGEICMFGLSLKSVAEGLFQGTELINIHRLVFNASLGFCSRCIRLTGFVA